MDPTLAKALFVQYQGKWYGPPALLTRPLALSSEDNIIDGRSRLRARAALGLQTEVPHHIFLPGATRDSKGVLLPRMLALAGHCDRAWQRTPGMFKKCPGDLRAYLSVPPVLAQRVWATRHRIQGPEHIRARNARKRELVLALDSNVLDRLLLEETFPYLPMGASVARLCFMVTDELYDRLKQFPNMSRIIRNAVITYPDAEPFVWHGGARRAIAAKLHVEAWALIREQDDPSCYVEACCRAFIASDPSASRFSIDSFSSSSSSPGPSSSASSGKPAGRSVPRNVSRGGS